MLTAAEGVHSALDPFILTAAVLAAGGTVITSLAAFLQSRRNGRSVDHLAQQIDAKGRVERDGVLLCDYVDQDALSTVADQFGVTRVPDEVERTRGRRTSRRAGVGAVGVSAGMGDESSSEQRELYRHPTDFNILTCDVLAKLDALRQLFRDLLRVPPIGPARLKEIAAEHPDVTNVDELLSQAHGSTKLQDFELAVKMGVFLLVESEWLVLAQESGTPSLLAATRLGTVEEHVEFPPGVRLVVPVDAGFSPEIEYALVTAHGRQRLRAGQHVLGSVFGRPGSFDPDSGTLTITPIVIFSRVGGAAGLTFAPTLGAPPVRELETV